MNDYKGIRDYEVPEDDTFEDAEEPEKTQEKLLEKARFGKAMILELGNGGPVDLLVSNARKAYVHAVMELTTVDLFTREGIARGRALQNEASKFISMLDWIAKTLKDHHTVMARLDEQGIDEEGKRQDN